MSAEPAAVQTNSALKSFLSGGVGGMCLVAVGHPLDLVKVRLQTSTEYSGTFDCLKKTFQRDGIRGLYRGMATPFVGVTPIFALSFWGYDVGQKLSRTLWNIHPEEKLGMSQILFAGGFSAIPATAFMTPVERVKCLLQIQGDSKGPAKYKGPIDCATQVLKTGGIRSLYKGTAATLLRDIPGSVAYFGGYEVVKKFLTPAGSSPDELSKTAVLIAGGMAGVFNWTVAIPPDVLKSRLQTAPEGTYKGIADVFVKLVRTEGPQALFRGLGPAMIRAFPANAACFFGAEYSKKYMNALF